MMMIIKTVCNRSVLLLTVVLLMVVLVVVTSAFTVSNSVGVVSSRVRSHNTIQQTCLYSMTPGTATTTTANSANRATETENKLSSLSLLQNTKYDYSNSNQRMTTSKFPPAYSTSSWWKGPYSKFNQGFQQEQQEAVPRSSSSSRSDDSTLETTGNQRLTTSDSLAIPSYSTQYDQQRSDFINNPYGGTSSAAAARRTSSPIIQRQDELTVQPRLTTSDSLAIPAYSTQYDEKRSNFINNPYGTSQLYQNNKKEITATASTATGNTDEAAGNKQQQRLTTSDSLSIPSYSTQYDTQRSNFINNPYGKNRLYEQQQAKQSSQMQLQLSATNNGSVPATTSYDQQRNAFINTPYGKK